jgi:hypothetical protein
MVRENAVGPVRRSDEKTPGRRSAAHLPAAPSRLISAETSFLPELTPVGESSRTSRNRHPRAIDCVKNSYSGLTLPES